MAKGYKTASIKDIMQNKHNQMVSTPDLSQIRRCESYSEILPDLNSKIMAQFKQGSIAESTIVEEVKWAIANDFSDQEILKSFKISKKQMSAIKMGVFPYHNIATEFNDEIRERWPRKKKINIDKKLVISIKKEYVNYNGAIKLQELATKCRLDKTTISVILNLKAYSDYGSSYNSKIIQIKKRQEEERKAKQLSLKRKSTEKAMLSTLIEERVTLNEQIKELKEKIKTNLRK